MAKLTKIDRSARRFHWRLSAGALGLAAVACLLAVGGLRRSSPWRLGLRAVVRVMERGSTAFASTPLPATAGGSPRTVTVSSPEGLIAAVKSAAPGDTIRLTTGLYSGVVIRDSNFAVPVAVTSADPAHRAVFVGLKVGDSSGLTFSGLEFTSVGSSDPYYAFRITNNQDLIFTNLIVHGDRNAAASAQLRGVLVTGNSNLMFTDSEFDHMWAGITANTDTNIDISHNKFFDLDKGGIEMGGSSFVNIADNCFTNFAVDRGTHPDAIQLYTASIKSNPHDITVTGNLFYRGTGDAAQGIFIQDEDGTLPFQNLTVSDNAVIGGMWDSIYVMHASGDLQIKDNIAATWAGLDMPGVGTPQAQKTRATVTNFKAFIFLRGDITRARITMTGNRAQVYMGVAGRQVAPPPGNTTLGDITDQGVGLLNEWGRRHPTNPCFTGVGPTGA